MIVATPNETIFNEFLSASDKTLVVVTAPAWCGPCKAMEPILEDVGSSHHVPIMIVNYDDHQALASKLGVQSVPTFIEYNGTEEVNRSTGARAKSELVVELDLLAEL